MSEAIKLARKTLTELSTIGEMYGPDGAFWCHTLEDACRKEKIQNMTAIPAGRYEVVMAWSDRFQRLLPRLLEVPYFRGIYIHNGNYPGHTEGCLLLGRKKGEDAVYESVLALEDALPKIKKLCEKGKLFIDIEGGFKADEWTAQKVA